MGKPLSSNSFHFSLDIPVPCKISGHCGQRYITFMEILLRGIVPFDATARCYCLVVQLSSPSVMISLALQTLKAIEVVRHGLIDSLAFWTMAV
jgi:hypothetical protein